LSEAELAVWRLSKVQIVDIDPARQVVIMRLDRRIGNVGAGVTPSPYDSAG
jgi:hypothetical protein